MAFFGECWRRLAYLLCPDGIQPSYLGLFIDLCLAMISDITTNILHNCRLILADAVRTLIVSLVRELFMKALISLLQDIGELVASDPLDIISTSILDTIWEIGLGVVSIFRRLIRTAMAVLLLAVLCSMDFAVGSLRISMCLMDLCFDVIEVPLERIWNVSPRVCPILHATFVSLLILLVS